jgi:hypothetical protein
MYGTTMIARTRASREDVQSAFDAWLNERAPQITGFVDAGVLYGDDGVTLINWARFVDRAAYQVLADDPDQDRFWQSRMAPLLDGEPQWVDGEWLSLG